MAVPHLRQDPAHNRWPSPPPYLGDLTLWPSTQGTRREGGRIQPSRPSLFTRDSRSLERWAACGNRGLGTGGHAATQAGIWPSPRREVGNRGTPSRARSGDYHPLATPSLGGQLSGLCPSELPLHRQLPGVEAGGKAGWDAFSPGSPPPGVRNAVCAPVWVLSYSAVALGKQNPWGGLNLHIC